MTDLSKIRNFSIIAHIDHGKSTLADRLIQHCGGLTDREMSEQVLDNMDIEKERGITIKAQTVRLSYTAKDGETYELNLMDTPGHVDFAYEVSRSLAACEGALLVVDAAQGVEAQTLANVYQSIEHDHEIVPVINKIDLPAAEPQKVAEEIEEIVGIQATGPWEEGGAVLSSAKSGIGIEDVLEALVKRIPPPTGDRTAPLKASLVDSWYDPYLGVVILVRVIDGFLHKGLNVRFMQGGTQHLVDRVGCFRPKRTDLDEIGPGEIGFITAQIKEVEQARVGDTITTVKGGASEALPGYREPQPVVFCGFRAGFLGLLPLEIIQERLSREYDLDLITTAPSVVYRIHLGHTKNEDARVIELHNPADYPDPSRIDMIEEPWIKAVIYTPDEYLGPILKLCQDRRGIQTNLTYVGGRAQVSYELPLNEVVFDFYDRLKSISRGYASFDYEQIGLREGDLVKMNILVNNEPVDALSLIVHRNVAEERGRGMCERLKDLIPRHLFKIPIQAAIGGKVIARETIAALRKDVTAKCYGGDISRKKKLLEKQKKGKARMREYGNVSIPQEAFIAALRMGEE